MAIKVYTLTLIWTYFNKSTQRVQTFLTQAIIIHIYIAMIPDLVSQQISIQKSDKEMCAQTYLVCWTILVNNHKVCMQNGCDLLATDF